MALIKCKECGNMVSDRAKACPKCGCPVGNDADAQSKLKSVAKESEYNNDDNNSSSSGVLWLFLIFGIIALIIFIFSGKACTGTSDEMWSASCDSTVADTTPAVEEADAVAQNTPSDDITTTDNESYSNDYFDESEERYNQSNLNGHYKMEGYMTDKNGDFPIELSFDIKDGTMKNIIYKNVRFGGKIKMKCTSFDGDDSSIQSFSINGKDGSKDFNMYIHGCDNDTEYCGNATVGKKELTVILYF